MSVILRLYNGDIKLLCKGADSVIEERLSKESKASDVFKKTKDDVDGFAREGLRTLYLAEKKLDDFTYAAWNEKYV